MGTSTLKFLHLWLREYLGREKIKFKNHNIRESTVKVSLLEINKTGIVIILLDMEIQMEENLRILFQTKRTTDTND